MGRYSPQWKSFGACVDMFPVLVDHPVLARARLMHPLDLGYT